MLRTQCSTCLFSTPVHNLQLLVRSCRHHRVAPAIWNRPYIFQDLLSASLNLHLLSNHGDPNAHPGPPRKVPGISPQTTVLPLRNAIAFKQPEICCYSLKTKQNKKNTTLGSLGRVRGKGVGKERFAVGQSDPSWQEKGNESGLRDEGREQLMALWQDKAGAWLQGILA